MDIDAFLNNNGQKEVKNPNYNPRSKKNQEPKTLLVPDLNPRHSTAVGLALEDYLKQQSVDSKLAEKYRKEGINFNQEEYESGLYDKLLADRQSAGEKTWNALKQTVWGEIVLGTAGAFADLFDILSGAAFKSDNDYQNPLSVAIEQYKEEFKENNPIYTDPDKTFGSGAMGDWGWWMSNLPSIASSLTLLVPAQTVTSGLKLIGKGISATRKAKRAANGVRTAAEMEKMSKLQKALRNTNTRTIAGRLFENGVSALTMRTLENYQEARQTYNDMYKQASESLNDMSPEEYQEFLNRNAKELENYDGDLNDRDNVAKQIAGNSADRTFIEDYANIFWDILQVNMLRNPLKYSKNMRATAAVNEHQRGSIAATLKAAGKDTKDRFKDNLLNRVKYAVTDRTKSLGIVSAELSEGVEEAVNYIAQQEGMSYGNLMLNPENTKSTFSKRVDSYFHNADLWEAAFWGVLGGVGFELGGSGFNRIKNSITGKVEDKKSKNDKTKESKEGLNKKKINWKERFETSENKARTAKQDKRVEHFTTLKNRLAAIDSKTNPFENNTNINETDQEALRERAINEYITDLAFDAIDSGTWNLTKDYLRDNDIQEVLKEIGVIDDTSGDVENLIKKMDLVERRYNDNMIMLGGISAAIDDETPYEYLQLIARQNTANQMKLDYIDKTIKDYELQAEEHKNIFKDNLQEGLDYKGAIDLIATSQQLGSLLYRKEKILKDKRYSNSIQGQSELNDIDKEVNLIGQHLLSVANTTKNDTNTLSKMLWAVGRATMFDVDEATGNISFNNTKDSYIDFLSTIATRDSKSITKLLSDIFGNINITKGAKDSKDITYISYEQEQKSFNLTDENIIEIFGQGETGTGQYHNINQLIGDAINTKNGIQKNAKDLSDDYNILANLNLKRLQLLSQIANTTDSVNAEINAMHNYMNEARSKAINESRTTIFDYAKKLGAKEVRSYIFENNTSDLLNKEEFTEQDRKKLDDAISVLNLTSRNNKKLGDILNSLLYEAEMRGFAEEIVEEAKRKQEAKDNTSNETKPVNETKEKTSASSEPISDTQSQKSTNPPQQPTETPTTPQNPPQRPQSPQPTQPTMQRQTVNAVKDKQLEINVGIDGKVNVSENDRNDEAFGYEYKNLGNGERLIVLAKETQEKQDIPKEQLAKKELYEGFNPNETRKPIIKTNPILSKNDDGSYNVTLRGEIVYENEPQSSTSSTGVAKQTSSSTIPVDDNGIPITENKSIQIDNYRNQTISKAKSKISEIGKTKITEEQFNKIFDDILQELKQTSNDTDVIEEGVYAAKETFKKVFFRNGFAQSSARVMTSEIEEVLEGGKIVHSKEYKDAVAQMLDDYCKDFNIQTINGKRYVKLEDILRRANSLYESGNVSDIMYSDLVEYLNSDEYNGDVEVIDRNNENVKADAKKTVTEKLDEIITIGDSQRIDIDSFFENPTNEFREAFDSLRVGDNLVFKTTGDNNNKNIILYKNGKPIGRLPVPRVDKSTGAISKTNMGWLTKVWYDANDKQTHSNLQPIFREILLHKNELTNKIYGTILILNYDSTINKKDRSKLQKELYDDLNNFINSTFGASVNPIDSKADKFDVVNHICNLFKYFDINSVTPEEQLANINDSLNKWFEKLYQSYTQIEDIISGNLKISGFQVTKITSGELIKNVSEQATEEKSNYYEFTPITQALANIDDAILTIVDPEDLTNTISSKPITLAKEQVSKRNRQGTIYIVIPKNNVDKKDSYTYNEIDTIIATSVRPNDDKLKGDVKQIYKAVREELNTLVDEYFNNPTIENYNKLDEFCQKVFYTTTKDDANLLYGVKPNIGLTWGVKYVKNQNSEDGFRLQRKGYRTLNIIPPKPSTNAETMNEEVALWRRQNNKNEWIDGSVNEESKNSLKDILFNLFDNTIFNVSSEHILGDNNNSEPNGLITRDKATREVTISIPNSKTGKPLVKKYKSFNDLVIKGGFLRVNTHQENGSNYRHKGIDQGGNQILEAKPIIDNTTPVEESNEISTEENNNIKADSFFNENNTANVDEIVDVVFSDLDQETKNNIKNLELFPKSITFVPELNYEETDSKANKVLKGPNAQAVLSTGETQVGRKWINMFNRNEVDRLQSMRKLIHEQLHHKLNVNKEQYKFYLDQIEEIYNEFEEWLNNNNIPEDAHIRQYLVKNKKDKYERLEEFLVESLTSEELVNQLNQIESKIDSKTQESKTIWAKLLELINKIFGWDVKENSLREKELEILRKEFSPQSETKTEDKQKPKLNTGNKHKGKIKGSNITEEETKIYPSVSDAIATIEPENKARFIREINNGEIQTKCK